MLLPVPSFHRRRGLQSSHTGALIQFELTAWRKHLRLAAKRPPAWTWRFGDRRGGLPFTFRTPPAARILLRVRSTGLSTRLAR